MTKIIHLNNHFGKLCANGDNALTFLTKHVVPCLDSGEKIVFDFTTIKNMNSSFSNALFANLIMQKGTSVLKQIKFTNCNQRVQVVVNAALELGYSKEKKRYSNKSLNADPKHGDFSNNIGCLPKVTSSCQVGR